MSDTPTPPPASRPKLVTLHAGAAVLHRVAIDNLGGTEFSSSATPKRFSPVLAPNQATVPVLYAATTLDGAIAETIFHDTDDDPDHRGAVLRASFHNKRASLLSVAHDLRLVDLTDRALAALGLSRAALIATLPAAYPVTRLWGQFAHDQFRTADGIQWTSRRDPAHSTAVMLFGDRVSRRDLGTGKPTTLYDGPGLDIVLTVATVMNVTVVV
jgi:hypothetical protein